MKGSSARRRQLLSVLFDRLIVRDGEIVNYVPSADRVGETVDLVERAIQRASSKTCRLSTRSERKEGHEKIRARAGREV